MSRTYPIGKIRFEDGKANRCFFCRDGGPLWVQPIFSDPFAVDETGRREVKGQPLRSSILWGDAERAVFSSNVVDDGATEDRAVVLDYAGQPIQAPIVVGRYPEDSSVYALHIVSSGRSVAVLEERGERAGVVVYALSDGAKLRDHDLPHACFNVRALGVSDEAAYALANGELFRLPFDGGAVHVTKVASEGYEQAFVALGGSRRLPTGRGGEVLAQGFDGELVLIAATGAVLFRHDTSRGYIPSANVASTSVANLSPSGARVVAAVGREAASKVAVIEEYDRAGELQRRLEWKCGKSETVYDVAIDDEGWIALATTHRAELFAPEAFVATAKPKAATKAQAKK